MGNKPIYGFWLDDDNKLCTAKYDNYEVCYRGVKKFYHFLKPNKVYAMKAHEKLDRYLSGYVYSFNPDPAHALDIIRKELEDREQEALSKAKQAQDLLELIEQANL